MAKRLETQFLAPNIRLLVTKGSEEGRIYETNRFPFIIGRDVKADFQIKGDNNISRLHAKITGTEEGNLWIEDLNSTNGVFVNNVRIKKKARLENGCLIIIGNTWLKFIVYNYAQEEQSQGKKNRVSDLATFCREVKKTEAILVLDLHNSSRLANIYGDEMALFVVESLNNIALPVFTKNKAEFYKATGDGYLVTFKKVVQAWESASAILKKVKAFDTSKKNKVEIHIRLCLHYGQVIIEPNGDRHGNAVNLAFRVEGAQYEALLKSKANLPKKSFPVLDRIFITEDFYQELPAKLKEEFVLIGRFMLKGIRIPSTVYCYKVCCPSLE